MDYVVGDSPAKLLCDRFDKLKSNRNVWDSYYADLARYCLPERENFFSSHIPGSRRNLQIFDSTAIKSNMIYASSLLARGTPSDTPWLSFTTVDPALMEDEPVKKWLYDASTTVQHHFNISNFYEEAASGYQDLGVFGITCMYEEADTEAKRLRFSARSVAEVYIDVDKYNRVDTVFRCMEKTARQIDQQFGGEGKKLPEDITKELTRDPDKKFKIVHAVMPADEYKYEKKQLAKYNYASIWIYKDKYHVLEESGFYDFPFAILRDTPGPGEMYGRSNAMRCFPDIKLTNAMEETMLRGRQLQIAPPIVAQDKGMISPLTFKPYSVNYVRDMSQAPKPLFVTGDLKYGEASLDQKRRVIEDCFFIDIILSRDAKYETAEAVMTRRTERMQLYSSLLTRLRNEFLSPLSLRGLRLLEEMDVITGRPENLKGKPIQVELVSPFSKQQKLSEIQAMQSWLNMMLPYAQAGMPALQTFNFEAAERYAGDVLGVPPTLFYTKGEMKKRAKAAEEQKQQQAMVTQGKEAAEAYESVTRGQLNESKASSLGF